MTEQEKKIRNRRDITRWFINARTDLFGVDRMECLLARLIKKNIQTQSRNIDLSKHKEYGFEKKH